MKYFWIIIFEYQNPSLLAKILIGANQAKNEELVNSINDELVDLGNGIKTKKILEMKIQMK